MFDYDLFVIGGVRAARAKRLALGIALVAFWAFAGQPNAARAADPSPLEVAKQYLDETFELTYSPRSLEPTAVRWIALYRKDKAALDTETQKELVDAIVTRLRELRKEKQTEIAQLMVLTFSNEELHYMVDELHSDLGRSIEKKMPEFLFARNTVLNSDVNLTSLTIYNDALAAVRKKGRNL